MLKDHRDDDDADADNDDDDDDYGDKWCSWLDFKVRHGFVEKDSSRDSAYGLSGLDFLKF